jgi:hypothetical protein
MVSFELFMMSFESSNMGFRKTKPPSGCSAISWDEKLLPQDADINIHNSLQENELEAKVRKKFKIPPEAPEPPVPPVNYVIC